MRNLNEYVMVADNQLNQHDCNLMIKNFETYKEYQQPIHKGLPHFTQINVTEVAQCEYQFQTMHDLLVEKGKHALSLYKNQLPNETLYWPRNVAFEEFRMKRYMNDGVDEFANHIDAADQFSCKRYLVFFWYLNDVLEGGETEILSYTDSNIVVPPKQGRLLMFPPMWQYPHRGNKPISNPKYIIGSYLHFV